MFFRGLYCLAICGFVTSGLQVSAQSYVSDTLKRLSYFTPALSAFESAVEDELVAPESTVSIESLKLDEGGSLLKARQVHDIAMSDPHSQVWLVLGRESEAFAFKPVRGLTLLICDASRVMVLWYQPLREDLFAPCSPTTGADIEGYSVPDQTGVVSFRSLSIPSETLTSDYEMNSLERWLELDEEDTQAVLRQIDENGLFRVRVTWSLLESADTAAEAIEIDVQIALRRDDVPSDLPEPNTTVKELVAFNPVFDQDEDWDGPTNTEVKDVLEPTYNLMMESTGLPILNEVLSVYRTHSGNPFVNLEYVDGSKVQRIGLFTRYYYYQQYTYQFAHELTHVLTNWEETPNRDRRFKWFEETIAELGSAFVIKQYEASPPAAMTYEGDSWSSYFDANYPDRYPEILANNWNIDSNATVSDWFHDYIGHLTGDCCIRELNWAVAREMLPSFLADPSLWESTVYLNKWDSTSDIDFNDFLSSWRRTLRANHVKSSVVDLMYTIVPLDEAASRHSVAVQPRAGLYEKRDVEVVTTTLAIEEPHMIGLKGDLADR